MAKAKKGKSGRSISVDFTKVEDGGGRVRLPEGDYPVKITKVEQAESQAGNQMLVFSLQITEGKGKGKVLKDRCTLTPKALWRLRNLLMAAGIDVPKKVMNIPIDKLIGKELAVTLTDEEYEGKMYSRVSDFLDMDTYQGADGDDDEDDEDEDEDEDDDDELEEIDLDDEL